MECPSCGNESPGGSQVCQLCGTSLGGYLVSSSTRQGMVSFPDAIRLGFQHYFDFRGRSTRAEYWWWILFTALAALICNVFDLMTGTLSFDPEGGGFGGLTTILFRLATMIPMMSVAARRLHDINKSGWWQLLSIVGFLIVPVIILLVWYIRQGDTGPNKHGPDPRQATEHQPYRP